MTYVQTRNSQKKTIYGLFVVAITLNIAIWLYARDMQARWLNVPPVPPAHAASSFALGDSQLSYRVNGLMLQNLGDTGGRSTRLDDYDYDRLSKWFFLMDALDPRSNYVPFLAAYYYGAADDPQKLYPLLDYLQVVGRRAGGEKWRWLVQAIYIARWHMNDLDKALELARDLAAIDEPGMPGWSRQMPAFILNAKGNKEEALALMLETLRDNVDTMHPNEVNATKDYICTRLLDVEEAKRQPLCRTIP